MCFDTAASDIGKGSAKSVTLDPEPAINPTIRRRTGCETALYTASSLSLEYSTIWLSIATIPTGVNTGRPASTCKPTCNYVSDTRDGRRVRQEQGAAGVPAHRHRHPEPDERERAPGAGGHQLRDLDVLS